MTGLTGLTQDAL